MRSLYESILSDIEDTLDIGSNIADNVAMNGEDSDLRHMFTVGNGGEPFKLSNENGKRVLTVDIGPRNQYRRLQIDCDAYCLSKIMPNIDEVEIIGGVTIECHRKGLKEQLCGSIVSDNISIRGCQHVTGVDFTLKQLSTNKYNIPYLQFINTVELRNCNIEFTYKSSASRLLFNEFPEFNNVSSKTTQIIEIDSLYKNGEIWGSPAYKKLFAFPYMLDRSTMQDGQLSLPEKIKINSLKDLRKLVIKKQYHSQVFSEWPVKLIKGAKLSDMIDVSRFDNLYMLRIIDPKMSVIFVNTKHPSYDVTNLNNTYHIDMLKDTLSDSAGHRGIPVDKAPITADGYKVIVYRK